MGTTAVVVGLAVVGRPIRANPAVFSLLCAAAVVAIAGGCVAALAYRDASDRIR